MGRFVVTHSRAVFAIERGRLAFGDREPVQSDEELHEELIKETKWGSIPFTEGGEEALIKNCHLFLAVSRILIPCKSQRKRAPSVVFSRPLLDLVSSIFIFFFICHSLL